MENLDYLNGLRDAFNGKYTDIKIKNDSEYLDLVTTIILEFSEKFSMYENKYPVNIKCLQNPFYEQYEDLLTRFRDSILEATGAYVTSADALLDVYDNIANELPIDRKYLSRVNISGVYDKLSDILLKVRDLLVVKRIMKSLYEVLTFDVDDMECLTMHVKRLERYMRANHEIVYNLD